MSKADKLTPAQENLIRVHYEKIRKTPNETWLVNLPKDKATELLSQWFSKK